ncbi:M3 family metallopeptidase [Streptomyces sp. NPDC056479]|uniref:M3 family metallopeptidase n=1 Tax=Streptomyces sp. NPDC056479 TaxID=3345832 RepID=UPI0036928217
MIFTAPDAQEIDRVLATVRQESKALSDRLRDRIAELDTEALLDGIRRYELCVSRLQRVSVYAELLYALHDQGPAATGLLRRLDAEWARLVTELEFFEPALAAHPDPGDLDPYTRFAHHTRTTAASEGPGGPHEVALTALLPTGTEGWQRLAQQLLARIRVEIDGEPRSIGEALPTLYSPDRAGRAAVHASINRALEPELELRATALGMIVADGEARAGLRGTDWLEARHRADGIRPDEVAALLAVADECTPIIHEHYALKCTLMGHDRLADFDRYAPLDNSEQDIAWPDAVDIVIASFRSVDPDFEKLALSIFESGCVDAAPRPGKQRSAFTRAIPGQLPCISMNFTGRVRDILTLGHEVGHAVHMRLSSGRPFLAASPPSMVNETVALFCEAMTVRTLLAGSTDPRTRASVLARWLEDQMVAVGRHAALHRFEVALRAEVHEVGTLEPDRIGELWTDGQRRLYGPAVEPTDGYRMWWSYLGPLFTDPGSHYPYIYGQLAALALLSRYDEDPAGFGPRFHRLLSAGDTLPPDRLLGAAGVRTTEADDWRRAAHTLRDQLTRLNSLARQLH